MTEAPATYDCIVRGGTAILPDGAQPLDIAIRDGRIAALLGRAEPARCETTIDATGLQILPGAIDIHFHIRAPSYPNRGTVESETTAAAAGGVTTIFEMPIAKPACSNPSVVRERKRHFAENAVVDFALYGAPGSLRPADIDGMLTEGVIGFKMFTTEAPRGRQDEFDGISFPTEDAQLEAMTAVARSGRPLVVHAESNRLVNYFTQAAKSTGRKDPRIHSESRPAVAEAVAIAQLAVMNRRAGAALHIAHVTSKAAVDVLRAFRHVGSDISAETCPQYLRFTEEVLDEYGAFAKINPPLRTEHDQRALWSAIQDGTLSVVATDHSPFSFVEKDSAEDIWAAPPGHPGAEEFVLGMLDKVHDGVLTLEHVVRLISANGAKRFGLYPRKGAILPGSDADLVLVDLGKKTTIRRAGLHTAARDCDHLYDGATFHASIEATIVRGKTVFRHGKILGRPGDGHFVAPS